MRLAITLLGISFLSAGFTMMGCSKAPDTPLTTTEQKTPWQAGDWIVGEPLHHANLTIVPLLSTSPRTDDRFITLDEGLKAGTVEILEVGPRRQNSNRPLRSRPRTKRPKRRTAIPQLNEGSAARTQPHRQAVGNRVNTLMVVNRSEKPLYLMPGEIVVGGQQDRVVGQEVVVQPTRKPVPIDVYCVEHGRWHNRSQEQYAAVLASDALMSNPALPPQWPAAPPAVWMPARRKPTPASSWPASAASARTRGLAVIYNNDQGKVWDEVAKANAASGARTDSGRLHGQLCKEEVVDRLQPYLEELQQPVADTARVVGVVVAINGQAQSYDVFESTPLFKKLWPKLLKSAALDAATQADATAKPEPCSRRGQTVRLRRAGRARRADPRRKTA